MNRVSSNIHGLLTGYVFAAAGVLFAVFFIERPSLYWQEELSVREQSLLASATLIFTLGLLILRLREKELIISIGGRPLPINQFKTGTAFVVIHVIKRSRTWRATVLRKGQAKLQDVSFDENPWLETGDHFEVDPFGGVRILT